jgi:hypothetical protein
MKAAALFVQLYLVEGPAASCRLEDLRWAWRLFMAETGVQEPESWLRDLVLDHGAVLEEPPRGQARRGWAVRGLGLNPAMTARHAKSRLERIGLSRLKPRGTE